MPTDHSGYIRAAADAILASLPTDRSKFVVSREHRGLFARLCISLYVLIPSPEDPSNDLPVTFLELHRAFNPLPNVVARGQIMTVDMVQAGLRDLLLHIEQSELELAQEAASAAVNDDRPIRPMVNVVVVPGAVTSPPLPQGVPAMTPNIQWPRLSLMSELRGVGGSIMSLIGAHLVRRGDRIDELIGFLEAIVSRLIKTTAGMKGDLRAELPADYTAMLLARQMLHNGSASNMEPGIVTNGVSAVLVLLGSKDLEDVEEPFLTDVTSESVVKEPHRSAFGPQRRPAAAELPQQAVNRTCDRCGALAKQRMVLPVGSDLLFCDHHARTYANARSADGQEAVTFEEIES
jgi:hypothetical protein